MQSTTNYDIFKIKKSNRPIDAANLKKITNSIRLRNLLDFEPILVDKDMYVIDGQHRLEAAKILGVPIYYIVNNKLKDDDIIILNTAKKLWGLSDYLNFYAQNDNENYKKLISISKKYNLSLKALAAYFGLDSPYSRKDFKTGETKITQEDISLFEEQYNCIKIITDFIDQKTMGRKTYLKSYSLIRALKNLLNYKQFNIHIFINKLEFLITKVHPCTTADEYFKMFKSIYNYKNAEPID